MRKNFRFMITVLSLVFCSTIVSFGQSTTGSIEGTVKDPTGAVVPNVSVTVRSISGTDNTGTTTTGATAGFRRTINTNDDGFFRVLQVPPGVYTVTTESTSGFGAATYENVTVVLDKTTQLDIAVQAGGASAVVDVGTSDQPVDTTSNEIATSINTQKIELLPKGVDFTSVLKTVPGVRPEPLAGGFQIDGASGAENVFVIDGQEVTNYRNAGLNGNNAVPFQLVQEIQVKSSGFDAEFGGATGGVISVVTKGGSNQFRGEFGTQFTTSKLNANPRDTLNRFTSGSGATFQQFIEYVKIPKAQFLNFFPTANLSGPIIKDKLWFFGSVTPQIFETTNQTTFFTAAPRATRVVTNRDTFRSKETYEYDFIRLDASPIDNLRLSGTFLYNPLIREGTLPFGTVSLGGAPATVNFGGNIGTLTGSQISNRQGGRQNSNNVTGQAVYTPTGNLVLAARFSRGFLNEKLNNYFIPGGIQFVCSQGNTTNPNSCPTGFAGPSNTITNFDVSIRTNYEADASYIFNLAGRHEFKGGYQHQTIENLLNKGFTTRIYLDYVGRINNNATGFSSTATPAANAIGAGALYRFGQLGEGSNLNQAVYVQDKYQPTRRLTLNLGVRFEKEDIPSFNGFDAPFSFSWNDKVAPRLGFAYDLTGDGKTKIFGSYGHFFDRLKFRLAQGSFGGDFYRVDFFDILPGDGPYTNYTEAQIRGDFNDRIGGLCPSTGFIGTGRSRCQFDYRVASNQPGADIEEAGAVDSDLKPYQQREFTIGIEREFFSNYVFRGRYTRKRLINAIEDAGSISAQGSEVYVTGNPGEGLHAQFLRQFGYAEPYAKPERKYDAMELVVERRLANNYYFNANYTFSRLYGNYSGLANSDEAGRSDPGVNRSFDLPFIGFLASGGPDNGRLATDRPHVFNAYGSYIYNWGGNKTNSTEFGLFQTIQSGSPQTSTVAFITTTLFKGRGDLGRTPTFTQSDVNLTHRYRFGRDNRFVLIGDLNVINVLNEANVTSLSTSVSAVTISGSFLPRFVQPNGLPNYPALLGAYNRGELFNEINTYLNAAPNRRNGAYGLANGYQGPRSVRFGFRLQF